MANETGKSQIWNLIRDEGEAVQGYFDALEAIMADDSDIPEEFRRPAKELVEMIINDERDHLNALRMLFDTLYSQRPADDATKFVREKLASRRSK